MSDQIKINSLITVSKTAYGAQTGDEKVLMGVDSGLYYGVNSVGGQIWDEIQKALTVNELVERLMERYEVERTACEHQTLRYLSELRERGLITISE